MDRRKTADVLFYIFQCAKDDRLAFADAVSHDPIAYKQALADIKAFETLQIKLFGTKDSEMDRQLNNMEAKISIQNLSQMIKENPELFTHAEGCECEYCTKGEK